MPPKLRVGILAGEMSGDVLGAGLMKALKSTHPDVIFTGIGGALMQAQGLASMVTMDRLSVMGFVEPLKRLPELLRIRRQVCKLMLSDPPDVFIGIDSPSFNLGVEKRLKLAGIPVVHYVSPSVWAWRAKRIHKIRFAVDLMLTLFPFEAAIYQENNIPVRCIGHTLADKMPITVDAEAARQALDVPVDAQVLALLPGSRQGEVARMAPVFLQAAALYQDKNPKLQVLLPAANRERRQQIEQLLQTCPSLRVNIVDGRAQDVMAAADQILIASGTATLEALLCKKPMVVCYRMAAFSYAIISRLLKVPYFSLPNLLAQEALVPELVQNEVNSPNLYRILQMQAQQSNDALIQRFTDIHLSLKKNADQAAAHAVLELIDRRSSERT